MIDDLVATGDISHADGNGRNHAIRGDDRVPAGVFTDAELADLVAAGAIARRGDLLQPPRDEIKNLRDEIAGKELHLRNLQAALKAAA